MRNNYLATIYERVLKNEPLTKINNELVKITVNKGIKDKDSLLLLIFALKIAKKANKIGNSYKKSSDIADNIVNMVQKTHFYDNSIHLINQDLRKMEELDKKAYLDAMIGSKDVFFIASSHDDSALDHKPYQGKIYVDRYWWQKTKNEEVRKYINKNHIRTIQWVTGKPVWFVTRPNCRHYFIRATIDQVLSGNYTIPTRKIGPRGDIQTKKNKTLEYYEERLRLYKRLYDIKPTESLKALILKTEILIKKWKR